MNNEKSVRLERDSKDWANWWLLLKAQDHTGKGREHNIHSLCSFLRPCGFAPLVSVNKRHTAFNTVQRQVSLTVS